MQTWTGTGIDAWGSANALDINGYVGGIIVVSQDEYTTEIDLFTSTYDHTCLYYDQACCAGAPDCAHNNPNGCLVIDETVQALSAFFTQCDTVCIDTIYKD